MKPLTPRQELLKRLLLGFASLFVLVATAREVRAGAFNMHGYILRRADHPIVFWLWAACIAAVGLPMLWWAIVGTRGDPNS